MRFRRASDVAEHRRRLAALEELQAEGRPLLLPDPVTPSGRIYRDIHGLGNLYDSKGSVASPELIAANVGVIYGHNLEATLARQLMFVDAVSINLTLPAAMGDNIETDFSFASDHRLLSTQLMILSPVANFDAAILLARPFGDPSASRLVHWPSTGVSDPVVAAIANTVQALYGISATYIGKAATNYTLRITNIGATQLIVRLEMLVLLQPEGTRIAG